MTTLPESIAPSSWRSAFGAARRALAANDLATARRLFDRLAQERPHDLELVLYARWVAGPPPGERPRDEGIESLALRALGEHASRALPLCVLGYAALARNDLHGARILFRHAEVADPTLPDAARGTALSRTALAREEARRRGRAIALAAAIASALFAAVAGTSCAT